MDRFYGAIGYGVTEETKPGVWTETILEKTVYGDIVKNTKRYDANNNVNSDITINNQFSIIADSYALENIHLMKYVKYLGTKWKISSVDIRYPRLILTTGGVYNGKQA
jgi:hypothetical protein